MAVNPYITLETTDGMVSKRFKALTYAPLLDKQQSVEPTLGGVAVTQGNVIKYDVFTLKVPFQVTDAAYGTRADMEALYCLNNPNAERSSTLIYTDHYGDLWDAVLVGQMPIEAGTTVIDGAEAFFIVPVRLLKLSEHVEAS